MQTFRNRTDMEESLITLNFFYMIESIKRTEYMKELFFLKVINNISGLQKVQEALFFKC